ncbi:hypothetical protein [Streptomyces sp. TLI_146]|uniref:hypothetical protein n=1 Tax=Streptomyces sp. TLI_146 TaxID=1938858 RepID=UPI000C70E4F1|nr:hypothetical protein [Streptomyces sp. TLI_146]PKV88192.1 hypothetical protein BX283_5803 [Streptomyces sp. TLI_146]
MNIMATETEMALKTRPLTKQSALPKREPQQSPIHSEPVSQERAQAAYTSLYTALLAVGVNLRHMSLKAGALEHPVLTLGPCDIPAAERLTRALERHWPGEPATGSQAEKGSPEEGA